MRSLNAKCWRRIGEREERQERMRRQALEEGKEYKKIVYLWADKARLWELLISSMALSSDETLGRERRGSKFPQFHRKPREECA